MKNKQKIIAISIVLFFLINITVISYLAINGKSSSYDPKVVPKIILSDIDLPRLFPEAPLKTPNLFLLNIWGTWCMSCHVEHPTLLSLSEDLAIVGINWYDSAEEAKAFLDIHGNPYQIVFIDEEGQYAVNLGVTSAPENFLVNDKGNVLWRKRGILNEEIINQELIPLIKEQR